MKPQQAAPFGILSLTLVVAACARGGSLPQVASSQSISRMLSAASVLDRHDCGSVSSSLNFNGTAISKGSWLLFSSVLTEQGTKRSLGLEMRQSFVTFSVGQTHYTIEGPNMDLSLDKGNAVRLSFRPYGDLWRMTAPYGATGRDFLNSIGYRARNHLPGYLTNVSWSAKFYGKDSRPIKWRWGAAVYTKFPNQYGELKTKPLTDPRYPPRNADPAGTPEAFKQYVIGGGTGDGGTDYTGSMGPAVTVTPCHGW